MRPATKSNDVTDRTNEEDRETPHRAKARIAILLWAIALIGIAFGPIGAEIVAEFSREWIPVSAAIGASEPEDTEVSVFHNGCDENYRYSTEEVENELRVTVEKEYREFENACLTSFSHTFELSEPLGNRRVVDAVSRQPLSCGAGIFHESFVPC